MKKMTGWIWFMLLAGLASAQTPDWQVEGFVKNEMGEHLPGARVQAADSIVAISDALGFYRVRLRARPDALTAVSIGYFPKTETIRADVPEEQPFRLNFVLEQQITPLPEVRIGAKRAEIIVTENFQTDIIDFELIGEKVLLLMRTRKKHLVRLLDPKQRILAEIELPGQPGILHRSCTGVIHVAGTDFARELIITHDDRLDTFPRYDAAEFFRLVEPCVLEHDGYYFFRKRGAFNQSVSYWFVDPAKQRRPLIEIRNAAGMREAGYAYNGMVNGAPMVVEPNLPPDWRGQPFYEGFDYEPDVYRGDHSLEHLQKMANTNAQIAHVSWLESIRLDSIYAPLLRLDDTLLLFDHEHDVALRFQADSARQFQRLPIRYHHAPGWQKKLLRDRARGDLYALFAPGGRHLLRQLNPHNLEPVADYPLPELGYFPSQIKVWDGFAYFLARPDPTDVNARLYKVNIRQNTRP
jgi:hypothetical protein